jgi:hypothetical protein
MRKALVLVFAVACGHRHDDRSIKAEASKPAEVKGAAKPAEVKGAAKPAEVKDAAIAPPPPAALPPPRDLLGAVPADAPFAFVTLEPSDLPKRIFSVLDGKALAAAARAAFVTPDPIARVGYAMWAELGDALATADPLRTLGLGRRIAVYGVAHDTVVRIELADPKVASATLARAMKAAGQPGSGSWTIDSGRHSLFVTISANQLIIANGPRDAIHDATATVLGAAATPVTDADLRKLAAASGLDARGIGWIDPKGIAELIRQPGAIAELDDSPPACRSEVAADIASFDRITFGISELGSTRIGLSASVPIDPKTAAALAAVTIAAPSLPAALPGKPWIAASYTAPPAALSTAWTQLGTKLSAACGERTKRWSVPPPWDSMSAGALVVYGGEWKSFLPDSIDGMLAVASSDPGRLVDALGKLLPSAPQPKDGGPFVPLPSAELGGVVPSLALARRGPVLVAASGAAGKAHAADFSVGAPAPLFRLVVAIARMRRPDSGKLDDNQFYTSGGSFADQAHTDGIVYGLFGTTSLAVELHGNEVRVQLAGDAAPLRPAPRPVTDSRTAVRDRCRAILQHAFTATAPALAKLGVTEQLDDIATTYVTSIEADEAILSCAKLTAAQRACLAAAPDVLAAAQTCAPDPDGFRGSKLKLPPLFSFFGPQPLETKLHPRIDGKATVAKLAGTWVRKTDFRTETWVIDGSGNVAITKRDNNADPKTERGTIAANRAGELELTEDDIVKTIWFFMPGADQFYEGNTGDLTPTTSPDRFIVPLAEGYMVREPGACWVVTREGALVTATCKADPRQITVTYQDNNATYKLFPGWIVATEVVDGPPFVRQK